MKLREKIKGRISNWARFQTIVRVLTKHGFAGLIHEMGFTNTVPLNPLESQNRDNIPRRLRLGFEELGPTFIKLGQILSTRPDLLPPSYIEEFSRLTDQIPSFPFNEVERILEDEFGRSPYEIFSEIESTPIAAASIAQVHRAKMRDGEITDVVIKVQRPNIAESIQNDIQILFFLAKSLERIRENFRLLNLTGIVREFQRSIYEELDFSIESKNIEDISKNHAKQDRVILPKVVWAYSTKRILTLSEIKGTTLSQLKSFPPNINRKALAEAIAQFFLESIFFHGLFHCDAHPGNLIIQLEDEGRIGLVDFGMVGRIGPDLRDKMGRIFLALVTQDFSNLALLYTEVATFGKRFSLREFKADIEDLLEPNLSKPISQVDVGSMMLASIQIAHKYHVQLPRDLIMFYRAVVTLEHVGRTLDPDFTFQNFGSKFAKRMIQNRFNAQNISRDLFRFFEGVRSFGTEIPSQLKSILYKLDSESFFPQLDQLSEGLRSFKRSNQILSMSVIFLAFLLSATLLSSFQPQSLLVWPLWILSGFNFMILIWLLFKK